ncbi:hypothetical protein [Pseudomonas sp. IAC-BECa141]|uniref:hypothetical protein n=1 Tax=Pseudomonas sp. IAC-BECa141 TaxID=2793103 RepID=UPI001D088E80|nr:hypothetical protein [Pseudomonas sp. IAC-BECa141]UDI95305.1 hypothetical protein I5961_12660 [Pseudomonas sp. IAC-BECa141]
MENAQKYMLNIRNLFGTSSGVVCGVEVVVALLDGGTEIDRLNFKGKVGPGGGFSLSYTGKPGLSAEIISGPGSVMLTNLA